jgi:hypothetical protein
VLEGLPISQYREAEITIEPSSADNKPLDKNGWPELPMPRDSHMLPEHSQQLLRAARSGRLFKPPAPPEDDNEMKDEEEESKDIRTGFTVKKYVKVPRHTEVPEREYLAKRRKGLPSPYVNGQVAQHALRETKVKKLDADGNVAVYKVLVPEGQAVEGEVQPTDAAIDVAPATAAPGTIVEGVGVVNAEGVVVATDILMQTPPRRRPPPPKKKRGGPGRRKKVVFAEGATEQGTPASNTGSEMLGVPGVKREEGSVGDEGSDDEDQDMERTSTPTTPLLRAPAAPTSAPAMKLFSLTEDTTPGITAALAAPSATSSNEFSQPTNETEKSAAEAVAPKVSAQARERDASSSPDLPLSAISHSRQNSLTQIPTSTTTTAAALPEDIPSGLPAPTFEADAIPPSIVASAAEALQAAPAVVSAPPSEPDLMATLDRQLEKDNEDMAGS